MEIEDLHLATFMVVAGQVDVTVEAKSLFLFQRSWELGKD